MMQRKQKYLAATPNCRLFGSRQGFMASLLWIATNVKFLEQFPGFVDSKLTAHLWHTQMDRDERHQLFEYSRLSFILLFSRYPNPSSTATSEKKTRRGLPSAVPRWSDKERAGLLVVCPRRYDNNRLFASATMVDKFPASTSVDVRIRATASTKTGNEGLPAPFGFGCHPDWSTDGLCLPSGALRSA
jgi:hypothetical protein